ncbi:protein translocase, SecA subunit [Renibacterium salmoninarum ATCC 33209]|uniref:Protein translocase subunit SecA n=1 Tax=Renibacterium salmoninarum (strain ATCC 33209 / DSM 20767 / JCM 11484 / NBRC 15589 / NCIMB 2235) TaxID=288705 RepID=SECA_RENSM|nr:preprotein translocase subunit SecA [Renibacterium salmoninarum]A9WMN9.1 RecName: Full=Protein translocase subunit SecA [Renibacterium salmoninarum ATCC 33209]ABY23367.1 protein translocase, SecA subunit [Renibacterium salmoninarum ATCC 33209]
MPSLFEKILRTGDRKTLKRLHVYADAINTLEDSFQTFTDAELREETDKLRARHADGESLDDLLPEAFAAVREGSRRTLGMRQFDVQLMGGAALHLGNIAEMKTGEGKTLVATAPAYLNGLSGKGVHIVTTNDYLASYQSELMGRVHRFMGLTSGCILSAQEPSERRLQYAADVTYGTNNEFGFDYLRDNMAWSSEELVQRGHHFAIVDEVDSILIDEARTPLIISGPASGDANRWYGEFAKVVLRLDVDDDYEVDEKKRTVGVLEPGIEKVEDYLGISNLYESANTPLIGFLNNAIKAKELFKRDKDYVILDGEVLIVDEHTGRILAGRRYNEGMHQAIEAKESVEIKAENQTLATVTLQNYFRLYEKLSGMTGTAETEASEFMGTYELGVVAIPTNKPMVRIDQSDLVYKNEVVKFEAVVKDIEERHKEGQPVLVGTTSVEKSEYLSKQLSKLGIKHEVLNAKNHAREASIVAQAGRKGAVTVATNMAGRGTDIMLGGNAEFNAVTELAKRGLDPEETPEEYEAAWAEAYEKAQEATEEEHEEVVELGGLYVLGTERHESRRIDNQLRGRSGRQGDPGESRFYLSLTDDLMRLFNSGAAERLMGRSVMPDDQALESKLVSKAIASAQGQVEGRNAEQRKNVLKYDDVLNRQREAIYGDRRRILEGDDLHEKVQHFLEDTVNESIDATTAEGHAEGWDYKALWSSLGTLYPIGLTADDVAEEVGGLANVTSDVLKREILSDAKLAYQGREEKLGSETIRELERRVVLSVIGRKWQEHLYEMDYLKEGIGLRAMAQRDPLVEYQREGFVMFQAMMGAIREESVGFLFNLEVQVEEAPAASAGVQANQPSALLDRVNGEDAGAEAHASAKPVLNAPGLAEPERPSQLQFTAPDASGEAETRIERRSTAGSAGDSNLPPSARKTNKPAPKRKKRR